MSRAQFFSAVKKVVEDASDSDTRRLFNLIDLDKDGFLTHAEALTLTLTLTLTLALTLTLTLALIGGESLPRSIRGGEDRVRAGST